MPPRRNHRERQSHAKQEEFNDEINDYFERISRWCKEGEFENLYETYYDKLEGKYHNDHIHIRHTFRLILNNLLNEGEKKVNKEILKNRMEYFDEHIQFSIVETTASYDRIVDREVLTVDDLALMKVIQKEGYHNVFMGTPPYEYESNEWVDYYIEQANPRVQNMIDRYLPEVLQEMGVKWHGIDTKALIPIPQSFQSSSLEEFMKKVNEKESDKSLNDLIQTFITTHDISFENLSNNARQKLQPKLQEAFQTIAKDVPTSSVIYVRGYYNNEWKTVKKLTPEEFNSWMNEMFVNPEGGFIINYQDNTHYQLTDGDIQHGIPAYIFSRIHLSIATGKHKDGGNFCKYYYIGNDKDISKWIRERYQISNCIPTIDDKDLMEPCAIHSILLGIKNRKQNPLTDKQRQSLTDYLYSRIKTRYINSSSLAIIAEEIHTQIEIYDIDGLLIHKYTSHGNKYTQNNDRDNTHRKEGILFGTKYLDEMNSDEKRYYKYYVKLILWEDHFFVFEQTPFSELTSNELIKKLLDHGELKPLNILQSNIYSTKLPEYKLQQLSWGQWNSVFMTPKQVYSSLQFENSITEITKENIHLKIDSLDDWVLPQLGYKLFLEELINKNIDIYADSSIPKNFIRQSIKGPRFSISKGQICGATVMLDRNSNHSFALSQIDLPIGKPRLIKDGSSGIFIIDADIEYTPQHELDKGFNGRCVINSIDAKAHGMKINHIYRGYYWNEIAKQPLKELMEYLYSLRKQHPKIKKVMNSMYGKLIEKAPEIITRNTTYTNEIRTSPLIKEFRENDTLTTYKYYNDIDFNYNFTCVASLLLAQQRKNMYQVFRVCNEKNIPMYYSAADSIAIPWSNLSDMKQFMGSALGEFKIEASNDVAIFVKPGLYYCGSNKIITSLPNMNTQDIEEYVKSQGITIDEMFKNIVNGTVYKVKCKNGQIRELSAF